MTTLHLSTTVFRIDPATMLFLYAEDVLHDESGHCQLPGNCILTPVPDAQEGKWPAWRSECQRTNFRFGQPGTGVWEMLDDYRKAELYLVADGAKYELESEQSINDEPLSYPGYGALPAWLTTQERPSLFHTWTEGAWVLDEAAKLANDEAMERAWRDGEIARITWLRDRHRDETEQSLPATLSEQQYQELIEYIQDLRDWPAHGDFPQVESRPVAPAWLAQ